MIVRILGEGQFRVEDDRRATLESLDQEVAAAVDRNDETAFGPALSALVDAVRTAGVRLPDDQFAPSDLVVPFSDASLAETRDLLAQSGEAAGEGIG